MAKRISDLSAATSTDATDSDLLPIVDAEAGETKKITRANLLNDAVATASIQDDAVTTAKIADASITNAKLSTTAGELGGAWQSWTPTWTNFTLGNGTLEFAKYTQVGKTVHIQLRVTLGSTSSVGSGVEFTLPVEVAADQVTAPSVRIGIVSMTDNGVGNFTGVVQISTATKAQILALVLTGSYIRQTALSSTTPFTWTNADGFSLEATYEAA